MPERRRVTKFKLTQDLTREELAKIVDDVQTILWFDEEHDGPWANPDKEWDAGTIEEVARVLINFGLEPTWVEEE
jgi:hypothetical protein